MLALEAEPNSVSAMHALDVIRGEFDKIPHVIERLCIEQAREIDQYMSFIKDFDSNSPAAKADEGELEPLLAKLTAETSSAQKELASSEARCEALANQLQSSRLELHQTRQAFLQSASWKVTRPLRVLKSWFNPTSDPDEIER